MHPLIKNILSDLRVEVLDEFNRNFTRKAFFDRPWPARQMDTGRGTLLLVSGHMRRSLRCTASRGSLYFSSDMPYFSIHNRGGKIPVTPAMRRYFWAMYYKNVPAKGATGKSAARKSRTAEYYRGMALTKKKGIHHPPASGRRRSSYRRSHRPRYLRSEPARMDRKEPRPQIYENEP
jgi:phage gpG-like protein